MPMPLIPRTVTRRQMRQLRIRVNAMYRRARCPSIWNRLSPHTKVNACMVLSSFGSPHRLPCGDRWGATGVGVRYIERGKRSRRAA